MKPLKRGKARTELAQNILEIQKSRPLTALPPVDLMAALLGGGIEAALLETFGPALASKEVVAIFWRTFNHSTWQLTRTLKASNLLDKVK